MMSKLQTNRSYFYLLLADRIICGSAVSFPQQLPQAGIDYAYVAAGVYRCGMGIALVWQVIGLLCHPRSVGIDWYEYQECHCAGR